MDEIICSKCGKANLLSDVYCRYCQAPLEKMEGGQAAEPTQEAEIPEWLKRIRELKKLDEEREKEKEKWRQQTLFGQNNDQQKLKNKATEKKSDPIKRNENPTSAQTKSINYPVKVDAPEAKPLFQSGEEKEILPAPGKDGLPEGFQPLPSEEDQH
jgi:hypothetical protein